jgi:hypothetical protein
MPDPLASLVGVIGQLIDRLEASRLPYALGGAVAYSSWGEPRATRDVDLNIWVEPEALPEAFDALAAAGVTIDRPQAVAEAADRGLFVGWHGEYRVDVFVPSIPFYAEALARRVRVRLAGRDTWVLSPEVLAVFKMLFFRAKDLRDLERLLAVQGPRFDRAFVRGALVDMLGADAEQVAAWDRLAGDARAVD